MKSDMGMRMMIRGHPIDARSSEIRKKGETDGKSTEAHDLKEC